MSVTFFTESSDDSSVSRWIAQWKDRWERAESQVAFAHYSPTRLSVAHRIVSAHNNYEQFVKIIQDGLEVDIVVLMNFIRAGSQGNDFETVEPYDITSRSLKFPILEKAFCASTAPGKKLQRARVLSNRQFRVSTAHAEVMARLKSPTTAQGASHVVLGYGDYTPWQGVVDALHSRSEWVVCIDANIDEKLIAQRGRAASEAREIIGFGSGVGAHGEANYTVSTEHFRLEDILCKLTASISDLFPHWERPTYERVAESVLRESQKLSGLSLVNATGAGHYIRDFMAYALTRKLLHTDENVLCDQLVSLDAYRHWFSSAESQKRPDLLWLVVKMQPSGCLQVDLRLIECKLANMSEAHLEKAREQLENGLRLLPMMFMPRNSNSKDDADSSLRNQEDKRPDVRYWWLQLHRLIASKTEIRTTDNRRQVLSALERLAEGDFDVTWQATALTFWTDRPLAELTSDLSWPCSIDGQELAIEVVQCGSDFVRKLCTESTKVVLPWSGGKVEFNGAPPHRAAEELWDVEDEFEEMSDTKLEVNKVDSVEVEAEEDYESLRDADGLSSFDQSAGNFVESESWHEVNAPQHELQIAESRALHSTDVTSTQPTDTETANPTKIPDRILLGESLPGNRKIYWEFGHEHLSNRHMLIFGSSGMGKTYTIQCLLYELGRAGQNSLILDYTNGFMVNQLEPEIQHSLSPQQHIVRQQPLKINPFREQMTIIGDEQYPEGASTTAQRVSGVFSEIYHFGDQQKSAIYQAIKTGIETSGAAGMTLRDLIPRLEVLVDEKGAQAQPASSVISKLQPFLDQNPFGSEEKGSWERWFNDPEHRCHVIQLAGFMRDAGQLITEFSLIDMYWFYRVIGTQQKPRVIVLDEVQNMDHREESPLSSFLREGRKFGFSLILATQTMSGLEKDERDRLFLAGHKLFFRPADTEVRSYAEIAAISTGGRADEWQRKLATLKKGECYSLGPSLNEATGELAVKPFKIRVTALGERN